jgi:hypothetical protein
MAPATGLLGQVVKRRAPTPKFDFSTIYWKPRVSKLVPNAPPRLAQITRAISGGLPETCTGAKDDESKLLFHRRNKKIVAVRTHNSGFHTVANGHARIGLLPASAC